MSTATTTSSNGSTPMNREARRQQAREQRKVAVKPTVVEAVAEQATTVPTAEEKLSSNERKARALDKRADELLAEAAKLREEILKATVPTVREDGTVSLPKVGWFKALWLAFKEWRASRKDRKAVKLHGEAELVRKTDGLRLAAAAEVYPKVEGKLTGDERKALAAERKARRLQLDAKLLRIEQAVNESVDAKLAKIPAPGFWALWRGFRAANRAARALLDQMIADTKPETITVEGSLV